MKIQNQKVLVVDDNEANLYMLETLLTAKGYETVTALNGKEALEKLISESFGMIISDILMPVMDGFQLCRHCKGDASLQAIPFIFYTATYVDEKDEAFAYEIGADCFIRKPMEPDAFMEIISEVTEDVVSDKSIRKGPDIKDEGEILRLYDERLVNKLEKKMLDLEREIAERKKLEEELHRLHAELERRVAERTAELEKRTRELERFNKLFVNREVRMVELKKRIETLEKELVGKEGM